jgi:hypothetical protein
MSDAGKKKLMELYKSLGSFPWEDPDSYFIQYVGKKCYRCLPGELKLKIDELYEKLKETK